MVSFQNFVKTIYEFQHNESFPQVCHTMSPLLISQF